MPMAYIKFMPRGPVDPGYGVDEGSPDNTLPGDLPYPDQGLPTPPPGVWPPPTVSHPIVPIPPGGSVPPGTIWPSPGVPTHPIAPSRPTRPARPDQGLPPTQPGTPPVVDNTLPGGGARPDNTLPSQSFWVVVGIPGLGWRYVCVDPSLEIGYPLPKPPGTVAPPIAPTPEPKK